MLIAPLRGPIWLHRQDGRDTSGAQAFSPRACSKLARRRDEAADGVMSTFSIENLKLPHDS